MQKISICWLRRDLRLRDQAALYHALKGEHPVLPLFVFDLNILEKLEDKSDVRVTFLHDTIHALNQELNQLGSAVLVKYGRPLEIWADLLQTYDIAAIYTNHDYEPYALERDAAIAQLLQKKTISFHTYKDQVIFEKTEVCKADGGVYTVFTPYSRAWKAKLASRMDVLPNGSPVSFYLKPYPNEAYFGHFLKTASLAMPTLEELGFQRSKIEMPSTSVSQGLIKNYDQTRDFPAILGTSRLGIHFRFGTISIREKALKAGALNETYLNELIWRDFYAQILANFPHVAKGAFRPAYDQIEWRNDPAEFEKWCRGKTGYPIVDAGMRELNATGYMHNRVRMITASFLSKHLLIDWRWGEAYFASKLIDFDLASNNGGWQWAAGCGTDAAPYFRIFSPAAQQDKFDKEGKYIRRWVPEYGTSAYAKPVVDHAFARERCLATYKATLKGEG
jgi:deoxyribodipyrimidine photo-lyase